MELEVLKNIISKGESLTTEFKSAADSIPGSFYESVVSFSNSDGGTILLGVNDEGIVEGINPSSSSKLQKNIITALNSTDCINPPIYIEPILINYPDGIVIVVQIPSSSQVHNHRGKIFIREYESDIDITENQEKVGELYIHKKNYFSESVIYGKLTIKDLDTSLFKKARDIIRNFRSDHPWLLINDDQMLRESVLLRKDFRTGEEGLTLAAALVFGKDTTIQSLLPAYKVETIVRIQNKDRWDDRLTLRTNLIDTYLSLKQFLNKYLPEKFYLDGDQRKDLRDLVFREVIGNVIIHREYISSLSSDIIVDGNAVIITNPNKAHFHGVIDPTSFNPYPKNPNIRKFFTALGWADEIGSGIRNTNKYLPLYSKNAKPVFIEDETFKTIIPLSANTLGDFTNLFQKWLELPSECLNHLSTGLNSILLPLDLEKNNLDSVILSLVPSWHQKGSKLDELKWHKRQIFSEEEIKKVPSWNEKSTNLLHKKNRYLISILFLCTEPISLEDIMKYLNYKKKNTFRENYLKPLEQVKFITKTIPDKPNDPNQKYKITESGKIFLSGLD